MFCFICAYFWLLFALKAPVFFAYLQPVFLSTVMKRPVSSANYIINLDTCRDDRTLLVSVIAHDIWFFKRSENLSPRRPRFALGKYANLDLF